MEAAKTIKDFSRSFIDSQVLEKDDKGKPVCDEKKLFDLAKANGVDASKYRKDFKENTGRIRMTIGNMIRGAIVRNRKAVTVAGATKSVPENLLPAVKEKKAPAKKAAKK